MKPSRKGPVVALFVAAVSTAACGDTEPDAGAGSPLLIAADLPATPSATTTPGLPASGAQTVSCGVEHNVLLDAGYDWSIRRFDHVRSDSIESLLFVPPDDAQDLDGNLDKVRAAFEACRDGLKDRWRPLLREADIGADVFAYEALGTDGAVESRRGYRVSESGIVSVTVLAVDEAPAGADLSTLLIRAVERADAAEE